MPIFVKDLEKTLSGTDAEAIQTTSEEVQKVTIINSVANSGNVKVGDSSPSITLEPGDVYIFENVNLSRIYAQGQSGDRIEGIVERD